MSDRELLELAAKAAVIEIWFDDNGDYCFSVDSNHHSTRWNPLTDDGDALRLAVKLGIVIDPFHGIVMVHDLDIGIATNDFAATRRAIVLAAAEIGKEMK